MKSVAKTFQPENQLDRETAKWFAVVTKYKTEKFVASRLENKGIETFLPLIQKTRKYTRKIRHVEMPLINCYVFVKITSSQYVTVLETDYAKYFVKIRSSFLAIPDEEIDVMKWVTGQKVQVKANLSAFVKGQEVEIVSGQLTGLRGMLLSIKNKSLFTVRLNTLGFDLTMDIDIKHIRAVHSLEPA